MVVVAVPVCEIVVPVVVSPVLVAGASVSPLCVRLSVFVPVEVVPVDCVVVSTVGVFSGVGFCPHDAIKTRSAENKNEKCREKKNIFHKIIF